MAAEVFGLPEGHFRSVTVTTLAALAGVAAALVSDVIVADPRADTGVFILLAFVMLQYPLFQVLGIDVGEFGVKDHLYVVFMSFSMWFVTWTIVLTSAAAGA